VSGDKIDGSNCDAQNQCDCDDQKDWPHQPSEATQFAKIFHDC
jgi:hypothetical protein